MHMSKKNRQPPKRNRSSTSENTSHEFSQKAKSRMPRTVAVKSLNSSSPGDKMLPGSISEILTHSSHLCEKGYTFVVTRHYASGERHTLARHTNTISTIMPSYNTTSNGNLIFNHCYCSLSIYTQCSFLTILRSIDLTLIFMMLAF